MRSLWLGLLSTRTRLRLVVEVGASSAGVEVVVLVDSGGLGGAGPCVSCRHAVKATSAQGNEAASPCQRYSTWPPT